MCTTIWVGRWAIQQHIHTRLYNLKFSRTHHLISLKRNNCQTESSTLKVQSLTWNLYTKISPLVPSIRTWSATSLTHFFIPNNTCPFSRKRLMWNHTQYCSYVYINVLKKIGIIESKYLYNCITCAIHVAGGWQSKWNL